MAERSERRYLKPPWMQRQIGNRLAPLFNRSLLSKLSVRGRRSGRWRTTPVAVLDYEGERYLVSYRGESDWARNLQAAGGGRLTSQGDSEEIAVIELTLVEREPLLDLYRERFGGLPTVSKGAARASRPGGPSDLPGNHEKKYHYQINTIVSIVCESTT